MDHSYSEVGFRVDCPDQGSPEPSERPTPIAVGKTPAPTGSLVPPLTVTPPPTSTTDATSASGGNGLVLMGLLVGGFIALVGIIVGSMLARR